MLRSSATVVSGPSCGPSVDVARPRRGAPSMNDGTTWIQHDDPAIAEGLRNGTEVSSTRVDASPDEQEPHEVRHPLAGRDGVARPGRHPGEPSKDRGADVRFLLCRTRAQGF